VSQARLLFVSLLMSMAVSLGGCTMLTELFGSRSDRGASESAASEIKSEFYGADSDVRATADAVKSVGDISVISSRALRLPMFPLDAITTFDYRFPSHCGGHHFRVYETDGTQILEFEYASAKGERFVIRDHLSGPNPFARPGLWSAYDHTADGVSEMTIKYQNRGSGILVGTYSRGPVTGLDATSKHELGIAYDRAIRDSHDCRT